MIYGYARVSTAKQMKNGNSLEDQKKLLQDAGAQKIVCDSFTGTKMDRPAFSALLAELKPRTSNAKSSHGILVKGEDGIMVKMARCCNPVPGDPVIGYITRGSGISVHRADCPNVMTNNPEEQRRLIDVTWDVATDAVYKANIVLLVTDKPGIMVDIMMAISENKININNISSHSDKNKTATVHLGLDITNIGQLETIMNRIKRIQGVYSVERVTSGSGGAESGKGKKR